MPLKFNERAVKNEVKPNINSSKTNLNSANQDLNLMNIPTDFYYYTKLKTTIPSNLQTIIKNVNKINKDINETIERIEKAERDNKSVTEKKLKTTETAKKDKKKKEKSDKDKKKKGNGKKKGTAKKDKKKKVPAKAPKGTTEKKWDPNWLNYNGSNPNDRKVNIFDYNSTMDDIKKNAGKENECYVPVKDKNGKVKIYKIKCSTTNGLGSFIDGMRRSPEDMIDMLPMLISAGAATIEVCTKKTYKDLTSIGNPLVYNKEPITISNPVSKTLDKFVNIDLTGDIRYSNVEFPKNYMDEMYRKAEEGAYDFWKWEGTGCKLANLAGSVVGDLIMSIGMGEAAKEIAEKASKLAKKSAKKVTEKVTKKAGKKVAKGAAKKATEKVTKKGTKKVAGKVAKKNKAKAVEKSNAEVTKELKNKVDNANTTKKTKGKTTTANKSNKRNKAKTTKKATGTKVETGKINKKTLNNINIAKNKFKQATYLEPYISLEELNKSFDNIIVFKNKKQLRKLLEANGDYGGNVEDAIKHAYAFHCPWSGRTYIPSNAEPDVIIHEVCHSLGTVYDPSNQFIGINEAMTELFAKSIAGDAACFQSGYAELIEPMQDILNELTDLGYNWIGDKTYFSLNDKKLLFNTIDNICAKEGQFNFSSSLGNLMNKYVSYTASASERNDALFAIYAHVNWFKSICSGLEIIK